MIIAISVLLMVALQLIVKRTRLGRAMRAAPRYADAARLMGISVDNTISFTFALGSALARAPPASWSGLLQLHQPPTGYLPGLESLCRRRPRRYIGLIPARHRRLS